MYAIAVKHPITSKYKNKFVLFKKNETIKDAQQEFIRYIKNYYISENGGIPIDNIENYIIANNYELFINETLYYIQDVRNFDGVDLFAVTDFIEFATQDTFYQSCNS